MNIEAVKNQFREVFTKWEMEENEHVKERHRVRHLAVRSFILNCDILSFTELELLEVECLERIEKCRLLDVKQSKK